MNAKSHTKNIVGNNKCSYKSRALRQSELEIGHVCLSSLKSQCPESVGMGEG